VKTPGSDKLLNTFTASTTPTAEQAQAVIDQVVATLTADAGTIPGNADVQVAARAAAEWRAAADIEVAYPNRNADVQVYAQLDARANAAYAVLLRVLAEAGAGQVDVVPAWNMPPSPPWGDLSPGSGADPLEWRLWRRENF
jgi:hypothetical protein